MDKPQHSQRSAESGILKKYPHDVYNYWSLKGAQSNSNSKRKKKFPIAFYPIIAGASFQLLLRMLMVKTSFYPLFSIRHNSLCGNFDTSGCFAHCYHRSEVAFSAAVQRCYGGRTASSLVGSKWSKSSTWNRRNSKNRKKASIPSPSSFKGLPEFSRNAGNY